MVKSKKSTTKTDTGQLYTGSQKSINKNPVPGVELEKLSKNLSKNDDLKNDSNCPLYTPHQLEQLDHKDTQGISNSDTNINDDDELSQENQGNDENEHNESIVCDYDETMDRDDSVKNKQDEIDDFEILNDAINDKRNEPDYQQLNNDNDDERMKGLSIEIEFQGVGKIDQCVASITHFTMDLLEKWIKSKAIDGVVCLDNKSLLTSDFGDVQAWTVPPRIIEKKRSSLAELMLWVKTNKSAYELYDD